MAHDAEESQTIEYKAGLNEWEEGIRSLAAFATARGGKVVFGIHPDGRRQGVKLGKGTLEDFANKLKMHTKPALFASIDKEGPDDDCVLTVEVSESAIKPVWAFHIPVKRVGRTNQKLEPDEVQRLMDSSRGRTWDMLPVENWRESDFDRDRFAAYLELCGQPLSDDPVTQLETLGLTIQGRATYALALLFAREPRRYVPSSWVQCGRFEHNSTTRFLDKKTFEGNVLQQIEEAIAFIARNTRQEIHITGTPRHHVTPEYPDAAIREAVINAICHRDYTSIATTQIRIHDDRLEVWNPGELPPGLTIEDLYREHSSLPRNRLLKETLARADIGERWGTGTTRIIAECAVTGAIIPEWIQEQSVFKIRFAGLRERLFNTISGLSVRHRHAVAHVLEQGDITSGGYAQLNQVSERTARTELMFLAECGVLRREGNGRSTHYQLAINPLPALTKLTAGSPA